jgi:hypothetical protein
MNEDLKKKLEEAIAFCAVKAAEKHGTALDALQYTQAAVNASNALINLECEARQNR